MGSEGSEAPALQQIMEVMRLSKKQTKNIDESKSEFEKKPRQSRSPSLPGAPLGSPCGRD